MNCLYCELKCPNAGIVDSPICLTGEYDELFGETDGHGDDEEEDDDYEYPCGHDYYECPRNTCRMGSM